MHTKLLAELGSKDTTICATAITAAGMLSLSDLRCLVDLYFERCILQIEQAEAVNQSVTWFKWRKFGIKANTPSKELARVRTNLLKILIRVASDTDYAELILYTQSRRLPPCENLELSIPSPIILLRIVPNIGPQDTESWTATQRQMLLTSLNIVRGNYPATKPDPNDGMPRGFPFARHENHVFHFHFNLKDEREEALAALRLLQQIGDERELALVRHLAEIKPRTPIGGEIQRAAEECLPFIELRAHQNRQAKMLLRPSDTCTKADPNTLLRPAAECGETLPQELLRPQPGLEAL